MDINQLPNELVVTIFSNLHDRADLFSCMGVCKRWKGLIDSHPLIPCSFYRSCHPLEYFPSPLTAEHYHLSIKDWLKGFGSEGERAVVQLEQRLASKHFPEILFWFIAQVLAKTKAFLGKPVATIQHSGWVHSASFSPDGKHLVTASDDNTAKIYWLVDGQWQEKVTIQHSNYVKDASFSPDGKHLVTASSDHTAKIYGLVDGQWQEKATIQHTHGVNRASFCPDGNQLVTASDDNTAKIYGLVDRYWKQKASIQHSSWVIDASFRPDGKYLVTASNGTTVKIHMLVMKGDDSIS